MFETSDYYIPKPEDSENVSFGTWTVRACKRGKLVEIFFNVSANTFPENVEVPIFTLAEDYSPFHPININYPAQNGSLMLLMIKANGEVSVFKVHTESVSGSGFMIRQNVMFITGS